MFSSVMAALSRDHGRYVTQFIDDFWLHLDGLEDAFQVLLDEVDCLDGLLVLSLEDLLLLLLLLNLIGEHLTVNNGNNIQSSFRVVGCHS